MTLAVVMVNECAGLSPSDWMYWLMSCWALPIVGKLFVPILVGAAALPLAWARTRLAR